MKLTIKHSMNTTKNTPGPVPLLSTSSFKWRQQQLENNQIKHIKLGFCESRLTTSDYAALCKALRVNTSLQVVEIGMDLPRFTLLKILDSVARLPCLQFLTLNSLSNLPRRLLLRLVSKPGLYHLELRNVTTVNPGSSFPWRRRFALNSTEKKLLNHDHDQSVNSVRRGAHERKLGGVSTLSAKSLVNSFADSIQSLHLASCDFEANDFIHICEWTEMRLEPLEKLSFAYSKTIAPQALETLISRAHCRQLDLTSCGLSDLDASVMARCLPQSKTIEKLIVAQNPLWGQSLLAGSFTAGTNHKKNKGYGRNHDYYDPDNHCSSHQLLVTSSTRHCANNFGTSNRLLLSGTTMKNNDKNNGFDEFIISALHHLKELDVSCCALSREQVCNILQLLAHDDQQPSSGHVSNCSSSSRTSREEEEGPSFLGGCSLESLTMLGIPNACDNDDFVLLLVDKILQNNTVLKCLQLQPTIMDGADERGVVVLDHRRMLASCMVEETDDSTTPTRTMMTTAALMMERSLEENYTLEKLEVGQVTSLSLRIDFLLRLNRAGRRFLRRHEDDDGGLPKEKNLDTVPQVDWATVLSRNSPDVVFWLLQNGVDKITSNKI